MFVCRLLHGKGSSLELTVCSLAEGDIKSCIESIVKVLTRLNYLLYIRFSGFFSHVSSSQLVGKY